MNFGTNAVFDEAARRADQERAAAVAEVSKALRGPGTMQCQDCRNDIARDRRLALPSAIRCIQCQTRHEQKQRHR